MAEPLLEVAAEVPARSQPHTQPLTHVPVLDSMRGVAILAVMAFHATVFNMTGASLSGVDQAYWKLTTAGWCGVDLFFVLSGFLITRILLHTKTQEDYFSKFYARRILRIFPLYYMVVIGYLIVASALHLQYARAAAPWLLTYTSNLVIAFNPNFVIPLPLAHFWSLAIEEQFYLVWPLVVFLLPTRGLLRLSAVLVVAAFAVRFSMVHAGNLAGAYRFTLGRSDGLILGGVAAVMMTASNRSLLRAWCWGVLGLSAAALAAVAVWRGTLSPEDGDVQVYGISCLAFLFAAGLFLIVSGPAEGAASGGVYRVLAWFGRYAYGMYVFHQPLAAAIVRVKGTRPPPLLFGVQTPFQFLFFLFFSGCTLLIAMISYHLVEKRFLRLKSYFEYSR